MFALALTTPSGAGGSPDGAARAATDSKEERAGARFTLVYTADVSGETEPCGCAVAPLGGLARQATLLARARKDAHGAVLYVDAGNLLAPAAQTAGHGNRPTLPSDGSRERARTILLAAQRMGLAAWLPGPGDWSVPPAQIERLLARTPIPLVSSNARPALEPKVPGPWTRERLLTVGGAKIGILGIVGATVATEGGLASWQLALEDPVAEARQAVKRLRAAGAEVLVALMNVGKLPELRAFVALVPDLDFAIAAGTGARLDPPEIVGQTVLLAPMELGREVGWVDIVVREPGRPFGDRRSRERLQARLADHEAQRRDALSGGDDERARHRTAALDQAIARERAELATPEVPSPNQFDARLIALDGSWPDDPEVAKLLGHGRAKAKEEKDPGGVPRRGR